MAAAAQTRSYLLRSGSRGRALRQMRAGIERSGFTQLSGIDVERAVVPHVARRGIGADAAEQIGDGFGITHGTEKGLNPGAAD
jgi:hypothetical protein